MPCRKTPAQAASVGESPWEASAARSSRSRRRPFRPRPCTGSRRVDEDVPFGVGDDGARPFEDHRDPFCSSARCRAESIRDASIDSIVSFINRAISPGMRREDAGAVAFCRTTACPARRSARPRP